MTEKPYHHGNLRNCLIEAGIELVNQAGAREFIDAESLRLVRGQPDSAVQPFSKQGRPFGSDAKSCDAAVYGCV